MSSLAGTTEKLRRFLKIGAVLGGIFFALYLLVTGGIFFKNILFPSAPGLPEQAFGELPPIIFSENALPGIEYLINTVTGELPTLNDRMLVYKIDTPQADLLGLQNARRMASNADFEIGETRISDTLYQWLNPSTNAVLQIDINTKDFEIHSNLTANQALLSVANFPDENNIKRDTSEFLNILQVNRENLSYRNESFKYYVPNGNEILQVDNIFNAKLIRVSLYNNNIVNEFGDFQFVYPNPEFPLVTLVFAYPSSSREAVLFGESYNREVLLEDYSEYQIKTAAEALEELKSGQAYLFNPNELNTIEITDIYLAYYLDKNTLEYAQPVIVFEGLNAKAYVPAVKYLNQSEITSE